MGILEQNKRMMEHMHLLPEFTTPHYFFILPAKNYDSSVINNEQNWFRIHYKLFFLCECSYEQSEMHVCPHEGYIIKDPKRFIVKYGSYLRTTLNMVRILLSVGSLNLQQNTNTPEYDKNIEKQVMLVNKLIDKFDAQLYNSTHSPATITKSTGIPLSAIELSELETFLEVTDIQHSLGNLYRMMAIDSHLTWVCLEHFDVLSAYNKTQDYNQEWMDIHTTFNEDNHEVIVSRISKIHTKINLLCNAFLNGFNIVNLTLQQCSLNEDDLGILLSVVINCSSIRCLNMIDIYISTYRHRLSKLFRKQRFIYKYVLIEIRNQSLKIRFRDLYRDGNMQMLSRILVQNNIHKILDLSAAEFLGVTNDLKQCLESTNIITGLILHYCNDNSILNTIYNMKTNMLHRLKLIHSLDEPIVSSYFCNLLKKNRTLVEIDLMDSIGFDDETFVVNLLKILENRKETQYVSLHIRNIKPTDAKEMHLIQAFRNNNFISRLRISTSVISNELIEAFIYAVEESNTLTHLEFYNCQVNNNQRAHLQSLYSDGNLIKLTFSEKERWDVIISDENDQLVKGNI